MNQFVVVTSASNLDVEVINISHIIRIGKAAGDMAEITVDFGLKRVLHLTVCESVSEILKQIENN